MKCEKIFLIFFASIILFSLVSATELALVEISDVSPNILMPGEETQLSFEIENIGDFDLENIVFSWEESSGNILPIGSSNTKILEELDEGDDETIEFNVLASTDIDPGLYELILNLKFLVGDETITQTSNVGIIVGGETDFDLSVSDISGNEVLLSVSNIGQNDANSVSVSIPPQSNFKSVGTSLSTLGNIEKNDYSIVSFQLTSISSSDILNVEIFYTDTTGVRQTITEQVEVKLSSTSSQNSFAGMNIQESEIYSDKNSDSNLLLYGIGGVSFLALIVIGLFIKKILRKEKE